MYYTLLVIFLKSNAERYLISKLLQDLLLSHYSVK